jgi:hypothetical protein
MLRPEEVPDLPDDGLNADLACCEKFIDYQLHDKGTKGGVAIVDLPQNMEHMEREVQRMYIGRGWLVSSAGIGRIRLERPATDPQRRA